MLTVVYESNTGFTEQYAKALSRALGIGAVERAQAKLERGARVIYMGWLRAGNVVGYAKAARLYEVRALIAVGMGVPTQQVVGEIRSRHQFAAGPVLLLQGGLAPEKLSGINKLLMSLVRGSLVKSIEGKGDQTPEEKSMLVMLKNGGQRVDPDKLAPIIEWARKEMGEG